MGSVQEGRVMGSVQEEGVMGSVQEGGVMGSVQEGGVMGSVQEEGVTVAVLEENVTVQDKREESVMLLCRRKASCHCTLGQSQLEHGKSGQLVCMRKVAVSVKRKTWILRG